MFEDPRWCCAGWLEGRRTTKWHAVYDDAQASRLSYRRGRAGRKNRAVEERRHDRWCDQRAQDQGLTTLPWAGRRDGRSAKARWKTLKQMSQSARTEGPPTSRRDPQRARSIRGRRRCSRTSAATAPAAERPGSFGAERNRTTTTTGKMRQTQDRNNRRTETDLPLAVLTRRSPRQAVEAGSVGDGGDRQGDGGAAGAAALAGAESSSGLASTMMVCAIMVSRGPPSSAGVT